MLYVVVKMNPRSWLRLRLKSRIEHRTHESFNAVHKL